jgi:DNA polymerase III delta subunit
VRERQPFALHDTAVVALAASTAVGAWRGGGPGVLSGGIALVLACALRRPALVCLAVAILGAGLTDRAMAGLDPVERAPVRGWTTLVTDPEVLDSGGVRAVVVVEGRRVEATGFGAAGRALAPRLAGERIHLSGALRPPPDDAPWLIPKRVVGRLAVTEVYRFEAGSIASRAANGLRRTLDEGAASLPRTARSLLAGVVLGDDRDQPPEVADDFRASGLSHLLAVSGQNVAFVLALAAPVLTRLRWPARLPVTVAVLAAFALLVRFEPSVLRAAAMAGVATLAAATGRPATGIRVLALAVTGLLLVDPLLVRSVGFGLSVGASAAILMLSPPLRSLLRGPAWLVEPLAITLAAQTGTMPLLVATFGGVPVISVAANLLAVPAAGPLMVWGLTGGALAGAVGGPVAAVLHVPTALLTWWLAGVARWGSALPLGEIRAVHAVALAACVAIYLCLRRVGVERSRQVLAASVITIVSIAALGRATLSTGRHDAGAVTLWSGHDVTLLFVDTPLPVERSLEAMRRAGARCVDVVAVGGGGRSAGLLAAAVLRRCDAALVVAPTGRAHPGWVALPLEASLGIGDLVVSASSSGSLSVRSIVSVERVGSAADATGARGPPGAARRRRAAGTRRGSARRHEGCPVDARRRLRLGAPRDHGDRRHPRRRASVTPPVHLVRGDDPSLVRDAVRRLVDELVGDGDRSLVVDEHAGDDYDLMALTDAAQTPPFLTERRVVVGRDLHRFKADELAPLVQYLADPLPTTSLVLVWEVGAVPKSLLDAVKKSGGQQVDTSPGRTARDQKSWLAARIAESGVHLDKGAVDAIVLALGEDVNRLSGLLAALAATFGPDAMLSAADVAPYLGEGGGVAPWELTDAVDRGDIPAAVDRLHRLLHGGERHSLVVLATLHNHVQRMLALDGSGARNEKEAAEILAMRGSTFPAKKALDQGRRLGTERVAQATKLLAQADVDLRGAKAWPDELVLELLVARLAHLARR